MGRNSLLLPSLLFVGACAAGRDGRSAEDALLDRHVSELRVMVTGPPAEPRPSVLLLGVFHFANPGLDAHKPKYTFDPASQTGREQVSEVLDRLAAFAPTKILVEHNSKDQEQLDQWYASYLNGTAKPTTNEVVTLGFALAQRLDHARVYGCDADGAEVATAPRSAEAFKEAGRRMGMEWAFDDPMNRRYMEMYKQGDEIQETLTLRQRLRLLNHRDYVRLGHGAYFFFEAFRVSDGKEFPGPDSFATMWHNRNLRIFSNIQRLASQPGDRLLVIVGAGHVPILQHCVQTCPTLKWVPVDDYLAAARP